MPEHQNTPTRACSDVRACPLLSRTAERARVGSFCCSGTFPLPSRSRTPERALVGAFCCSGTSSPRLEQQNEPTRARSAIRARSPRLEHQNEPRGSFRYSGTFPPSRTPQRALVGAFCCSGTFPPRLEQQNEPLWARSDVRARSLSLPPSQTSERALVGAFLCSVMSPSSPTGKTCLIGRVFAVRHTHTPSCAFRHAPTLPLISKTSDLPR